MASGYSMAQNQPNGGFSFAYNGTPISALSYAQGTGTPFYNLLSSMASQGDKGAGSFLQSVVSGPGGLSQDQATANNIGFNYGAPGSVSSALTWGGNPGVLAASTGGGGMSSNQLADILGPSYDSAYSQLQGQMNAIPLAEAHATGDINNQYQGQANQLQDQFTQGGANLDLSQQALNTQKAQSLRDLGSTLRQQFNSYNNQLGVMGAGNSSAANLLGYALSQQANVGRGDIGTQYGLQQTGINQQRTGLQSNFNDQMTNLQAWKQQQLDSIAQSFAQTQQQIQSQMANTLGDKARFLALYAQNQAAAQQAIQQLQQIQGQYGTAVDQLQKSYGQVQAGPHAIDAQFMQGYNVQPFTPEQLQGLSFQNNQAPNSTTSTGYIAPISLQKQNNQTPGTLASLSQ